MFLRKAYFITLSVTVSVIDDEGELLENQLPRTLLLMHRWYVSSTELAGKLLIIYPVADQYEHV